MDFLNRAFAQLSDLFQSMTPAARITTGLLLVVVVASLGYLFTHQVSGPNCDLMNGEPIPSGYLPKMEAAFAAKGLSQYKIDGAHIRVPQGQKAAYMAALADGNALPPNFGKALRDALNAGSTFESSQQREQRIKLGIQDELSLYISSMSGIEKAYVLYGAEIKSGFRREKTITATAAVKPEGSAHLEQAQVNAIRHLVAPAIGGLRPENVTVTDLNANVSYYGDPENGGSPLDDPYGARKRMYEQEWEAKIRNALAYVPGVRVTPNVELDPERSNRVTKVRYDPKGIVVHSSVEESSRTREDQAPGGRPGVMAQTNTAAALSTARSEGSTESEDDSKQETITAPNSEQTETEKIGLVPKSVSVAVGIPSSYFEKIWLKLNPPEEGQESKTPDQAALATIIAEETAKIQKQVAKLLTWVEGVDDPTKLVDVATFRDVPGEEIPTPAMADKALVWFGQYWSTLGMIGLALFSLLMLRSMVRAVPSSPGVARAAATLPMDTDQQEAPSAAAATAKRLSRFSGSGPSLREELSDLVQEDAEAAGSILSAWIGSTK